MPQPPAYVRAKDFTENFGSETDHSALNSELDAAGNSINDIRSNLAILQADDGKLRPSVVTPDSISAELRADLVNRVVLDSQQLLADAQAAANTATAGANTATTKAAEATAGANTATTKAGQATASATTASDAATTASTKRDEAVAARDTGVAAKDTAVAASNTSTTKRDEAVDAANTASTKRDEAVAARDIAVTKRDEAVAARDTAVTKAAEAANSAALALPPHGQCRVIKSGANLVLMPHNGNKLIINGTVQTIPAAGVQLAPTSLVANTDYYIYAYMNAGVMAMDPSTTAPATDAATGVRIKNGDPSRSLIGMSRTTAGIAWADSATQRLVISWFNRRRIAFSNALGVDTPIAAPSIAELSAALRCEFLTWAEESVRIAISGYVANNNAGGFTHTFVGVDSAASNLNRSISTSGAANEFCPVAVDYEGTLAEGHHFATLNASVSTGTSTYSAGALQLLKGSIQG